VSKNSKYSKTDFFNLIFSQFEHVSASQENADEFLRSLGLDPDEIAAKGLKEIKKKQFLANAEKTKSRMAQAKSVEPKVLDLVDKILVDPLFSFVDFLKKERPQLSFRNLESFDPAEIRDILIQHYTLKLLKEQDENTPDEL
jgi:hypothetical protein